MVVDEFVRRSFTTPVIDVRTPAEFEAGHIPGARNLPLFSNDERELIGTTYAEQGRQRATRVGLDLVGPRMNRLLDDVKACAAPGDVLVHCWRGGMRSESVAWLLNFSGEYRASTLGGGYKAFRRFALEEFEKPRRLTILGGMTGAGKTDVLRALKQRGEQVLDLENLASHKGSAFGAIGQPPQPTQQQFENDLAVELQATDRERRLWLEDESRRIGRCMIPSSLWRAMREAHCVVLERPRSARSRTLVADYGRADASELTDAVNRIERRLGGAAAMNAMRSIEDGDLEAACDLLLDYYDQTYSYGLSQRAGENVHPVDCGTLDPTQTAERLVELALSIEDRPVPSGGLSDTS